MTALAVLTTLAAAVLALAGTGAVCRAVFADPLDRIAAVLLIATVTLLGVFALGDITATLPTAALNLLLLASPVVAVASAAQIDIFHLRALYELSPIAHREFQYPAWPAAAALYGCVALAAFLAVRVHNARRDGFSHPPTL